MSINAFAEVNSDKEKGIERQLHVGGFVRYEFEGASKEDAVGVGNFLENEAALGDLGIKAADLDSNVVRGLFYYSTEVAGLDILVEGKPNVTDPQDIKVSVEPKYILRLERPILAGGVGDYGHRFTPASRGQSHHHKLRVTVGSDLVRRRKPPLSRECRRADAHGNNGGIRIGRSGCGAALVNLASTW